MNKKTMAIMLDDAHRELVKTVQSVPEDKLQWKPLDNGRAILDLLGEVAQTVGFATQVASSRGDVKPDMAMFRGWIQERADWTREFALEQLDNNTRNLLAAIAELSEDELAQDVTMSMHGGVTMPLAAWVMMAYRTFISRFAQINYIQTLYGDFDFH